MSTVAKTIGLVKFGADMIEHTMALGDKENSIKATISTSFGKFKRK